MDREILVRTKNLTKKYKDNFALNDVNIELERGKIYAFIGKNGAGKTTLLRILTGLAFQSSGTLELFGEDTFRGLQYQRRRIGSLIESPTLHMSMNAYENLELQRICQGIPNENSIENVLELVGLKDIKKKKVKDFSLGMRQRLGIAMSIINNPELLILDEPINGLDPIGIVEIRNLLKKLNKEKNMTILISSHILSELYELGTDYIIINEGKIIENLSLEELNKKCSRYISLRVDDTYRALTILEKNLKISDYKVMPDETIRIYNNLDYVQDISKVLSMEGLIISELSIKGEKLEEYFGDLIGGSKND